jgi:ABC-2 type transport system permease protein
MKKIIKTFKPTFKISIKAVFVYRGMMLIWMIGWLLSFLTFLYLWQSAQPRSSFAGFTKDQIISYYFLGMIVWQLAGWFPADYIAEKIRDGKISNIVAKPLSFYWYIFSQELAWHVINTAIFSFIVAIIYWLVKDSLFLDFSLLKVFLFLLGTAIAALVNLHFGLILGTSAFWIMRTHALESIYWLLFALLGGQMLPLRFFPIQYQGIVKLLPFRFMYSFPLELVLAEQTLLSVVFGFGLGIFWVYILWKLFCILWEKGLRNYTAWGD